MSHLSPEIHLISTPTGELFVKRWSPPQPTGAPIVLLHDSLGCVALWRDFPARLVTLSGRQVIAYDRLGFGASAPYPGTISPDFILQEAQTGFKHVYETLGLRDFIVLGHSVGAGMAVGIAARYQETCVGLVTLSAQAWVDAQIRSGIEAARQQFAEPGQIERLAKYHGDKAPWVLNAWTETWLSDEFREWTLDKILPHVHCSTLCLHGDQDEYGSPTHSEHLARMTAGQSRAVTLRGCGHVPHRECPDAVLAGMEGFVSGLRNAGV